MVRAERAELFGWPCFFATAHRWRLSQLFCITNNDTGKSTHCGVLEFSAEEGISYVPHWIMQNLLASAMLQGDHTGLSRTGEINGSGGL